MTEHVVCNDRLSVTRGHLSALDRRLGVPPIHSRWLPIGNAFLESIPTDRTIHLGLALRSRDVAQVVEAAFSNLTMPRTIGVPWKHQDIGILNNAAETSGRDADKKSCGLQKFCYSWSINAGRSGGMPAAVIVILVWEEKFQGDCYGN